MTDTIQTKSREVRFYDITLPEPQAKALRMLVEFMQPTEIEIAARRAGQAGKRAEQEMLAAFHELRGSIMGAVPLG